MRITAVIGVCLAACQTFGQLREPVTFQVEQSTTVGDSVYVVGSLDELGASDVRRAVKLEPSAYPTWRVTVSLPVNTAYAYQFIVRDDSPAEAANAANATPIGSVIAASTSAVAVPGKRVWYHSFRDGPILHWRQDDGAYQQIPMTLCGEGRSPGEHRWVAADFGERGKPLRFYFSFVEPGQDPVAGAYETPMELLFVQDGQVFDYMPPSSVDTVLRDYDPVNPPFINSVILGEQRRYRVVLPRGYAQNAEKHYPVLYMHDGQNVFEQGAFGTWNGGPIISGLQRSGTTQEFLTVAVDNTSHRTINYTPPAVGGQADDYVQFLLTELKPVIDAQYRTLTGPESTGTAGSSSGANVAMYMGWEHTDHFTRIGAFSGVWEFVGYASSVVYPQPKRDIRLYIDSGDSGNLNSDGFTSTYALRDNLITKSPPYVLEDDLRHVVGLNQQHNEAAWAARLPGALSFLYPGNEYAPQLPTGDPCGCGAADTTTTGAGAGDRLYGVPDGYVTAADIQFYVNLYVAGDLDADLTTQGAGAGDPGFGVPDGQVTAADVQFFVNLWVAGCP